ncbi:EAL domain-containing protein [Cryptosporangium phraense]|uniref:EAL domain-containing protein n=1 Tax=Cryptosporangium phraense TaxID=2593070 RepID=UPI001478E5EB|nr:EAL domain-containing protein [Cryptosporangium phraense]
MTAAPRRAVATAPDAGAVAIAVFAWEWARHLIGTSWVPDDRTVIAEQLRLLTDAAAEALLGAAKPESTGRDIGSAVVGIGFATPDALGRTLALLGERLGTDLELDPADPQVRARVSALLAGVGVGFARSAHDRTLAQQDAIRSSDLVARQRAERALRARADTPYRRELAAAVERGQVVPYFQPIVTLEGEELVGFEALARWEHPDQGTLTPGKFLPSADDEVFSALGSRLREDACRAAVEWQSAAGRPVFVGVNLSAAELRTPSIVDDVRGVLSRTGLPPELLHVEITEDATLADADLPVLRGLAALGVRLALDDVGTGLSRLAVLPSLPVHGLKLAASLLDPVRLLPFAGARAGTHVLDVVTDLAGRLGLTTTVEGIENAAEASFVRRLGITRAQGWHYGRPVPAAEVTFPR